MDATLRNTHKWDEISCVVTVISPYLQGGKVVAFSHLTDCPCWRFINLFLASPLVIQYGKTWNLRPIRGHYEAMSIKSTSHPLVRPHSPTDFEGPQLAAFLLNPVAQIQQQPRDQLPLCCPMEDQTMTSALRHWTGDSRNNDRKHQEILGHLIIITCWTMLGPNLGVEDFPSHHFQKGWTRGLIHDIFFGWHFWKNQNWPQVSNYTPSLWKNFDRGFKL